MSYSPSQALAIYNEWQQKKAKEGQKSAFRQSNKGEEFIPIECQDSVGLDQEDRPCYERPAGTFRPKVYEKIGFTLATGFKGTAEVLQMVKMARESLVEDDWGCLLILLTANHAKLQPVQKAKISILVNALVSESAGAVYIAREAAQTLAKVASGYNRLMTPHQDRANIQNALQAAACLRHLLSTSYGHIRFLPKSAIRHAFRAYLLEIQLTTFLATMHQREWRLHDWFPPKQTLETKQADAEWEEHLSTLTPKQKAEEVQRHDELLHHLCQPPSSILLTDLDVSALTMTIRLHNLIELMSIDFEGCRRVFYCEIFSTLVKAPSPVFCLAIGDIAETFFGLLPTIFGKHSREWFDGSAPSPAECYKDQLTCVRLYTITVQRAFNINFTLDDYGIVGLPCEEKAPDFASAGQPGFEREQPSLGSCLYCCSLVVGVKDCSDCLKRCETCKMATFCKNGDCYSAAIKKGHAKLCKKLLE